MSQPLDLATTYLLLEPDGEALSLPFTPEFWPQLMSGAPTDPGIARLAASTGRLLCVFPSEADWTSFERHPAGDEVLVLLTGSMTFTLETDPPQRVPLAPGQTCVVPRGVWHTADVHAPSRLLALTPGQGTEHRPR